MKSMSNNEEKKHFIIIITNWYKAVIFLKRFGILQKYSKLKIVVFERDFDKNCIFLCMNCIGTLV